MIPAAVPPEQAPRQLIGQDTAWGASEAALKRPPQTLVT